MEATVSNGEFTFTMREKEDKNGGKYLFAGIQMLKSVLFIFPETTPSGEKRWKGVLKPYTPKEEEVDWNNNDK